MNKMDESITQTLESMKIDAYTFWEAIGLIQDNVEGILLNGDCENNINEAKNYISYLMKEKNISLKQLEKIRDRMLACNPEQQDTIQHFYNEAYWVAQIFWDDESKRYWKEYILRWNATWLLTYQEDWKAYMFAMPEFHNITFDFIVSFGWIVSNNSDFKFVIDSLSPAPDVH